MVSARTSIEIDRGAGEVFAFVSEFPNNPRWQRGMRSCRWTSDGPLRAGSTYEQHARFLGKDLVNFFEVTEVTEATSGRRVSYRSTSGTFPIAVTRTVEPLANGRTRFTEEVSGDPRGVFRVAGPLLQLMVRASIRRDFPRLKALLENR